ncbi:hypothetical protein C8Q78DRAFT_971155 [Trametes maxima]|nr:hypothetical protein C8Q78DRAFT_971155 [Trametes maxima]
MHNLFLGELHHHCIAIWGLKTAEGRAKKQRGTRVAAHSPEMQKFALDRVMAGLRSGSMSTISATRKDYLEAIATYNSIHIPEPSPTKVHYAAALKRWVSIDSLRLPPVLPFATDHFHIVQGPAQLSEERLSQSVFSGSVLDAIRGDIQASFMPSWLPKPPRKFGSASHGKLSADQWRTSCTVNMVITLGRLWGAASATDEEKKALENFMHLIAAVDLATRRSMTVQRAELFDHHISEYLRGLRSLYNAPLVPNHHLSLHLIECLILFGPTHAWWAFPFERYNGLLQRLNTNHRTEDMPKTFMSYFYIGARLRWMMASPESWPDTEEFREMIKSFHDAVQGATRGTRAADIMAFGRDASPQRGIRSVGQQKDVDRSVYDKLLALVNSDSVHGPVYGSRYQRSSSSTHPFLPHSAEFVPYTTYQGLTFATREHSMRNSFVLLPSLPASLPSSPPVDTLVAAQVESIFHHTRSFAGQTITETFLVVDEYAPLSVKHRPQDPYRRFPDVGAWLCYNRLQGKKRVLLLDDVVSHFAAFIYTPADIGTECIVVKSLDRVSAQSIRRPHAEQTAF